MSLIVAAKIALLKREDGRPQRPPYIFNGYRNSNIWFGTYDTLGPVTGLASFRVLDRDRIGVGETGAVEMDVSGIPLLLDVVRVGASFSLSVGGQRVAIGTITAVLPTSFHTAES